MFMIVRVEWHCVLAFIHQCTWHMNMFQGKSYILMIVNTLQRNQITSKESWAVGPLYFPPQRHGRQVIELMAQAAFMSKKYFHENANKKFWIVKCYPGTQIFQIHSSMFFSYVEIDRLVETSYLTSHAMPEGGKLRVTKDKSVTGCFWKLVPINLWRFFF